MEVFHTPPLASSFTPLAEHQSRTPESFYDGPPVLHYHSDRCKVVVLESDLTASPALNALRGPVVSTNGNAVNGSSATATQEAGETTQEKEIVIDDVDVWVTSEYVHGLLIYYCLFLILSLTKRLIVVAFSKFLLYRTAATSGIAIPYPLISLHAIQRLRLPDGDEVQGLYMQLANSSAEGPSEEDEEEDSITMTIIPPPVTEAASAALGSFNAGIETTALTAVEMAAEEGAAENKPDETSTQALFAAVSACSNLHPDPIAHGDDDNEDYGMEEQGVGSLLRSGLVFQGTNDGGLPPAIDGSSGWITAENMHEYIDEEGNWIGEGEPPSLPLGPGAGSVRPRDDEGEEGNATAEESGSEETKWRRTE
jgi:nucleotide-sensitive chloride channel 1A